MTGPARLVDMTKKRETATVTFTIRLTMAEHDALKKKCDALQPPASATAVLRWLLRKWINE